MRAASIGNTPVVRDGLPTMASNAARVKVPMVAVRILYHLGQVQDRW
jgi:hypothetical protein